MKKSRKPWRARLAQTILLALACAPLLTACQKVPVVANDPNDECDHPAKPEAPYSDEKAAGYIVAQGEAIDVCRALLGNKPRIK